jgi:hypothetical protein
MGRGRTTTGMIAACLIATTMNWNGQEDIFDHDEAVEDVYNSMDGPSEEEAYLSGISFLPDLDNVIHGSCTGEYKTILQLVGVLSYGTVAKRLADQAIDLMQDVQNLRKAIYE